MKRTVDDLTGGTFEIPANPPIPAFPEIDLGEKPSIEFVQACSDLDYRLTTGQEPLAATACRICRATVEGRTICRACLYGLPDDAFEEAEVYEMILDAPHGDQNDTKPDERQNGRSSGRI